MHVLIKPIRLCGLAHTPIVVLSASYVVLHITYLKDTPAKVE